MQVRRWIGGMLGLWFGLWAVEHSRAGQGTDVSPVSPSVPVTGVAAVVNTHVITIQMVDQYAGRSLEAARRQFALRPEQFLQRRQEILRDSLEQLIERYMILDEFTSSGFNLPDSLINDVVNSQIRDEFGDRVTLMKTLRRAGETFEDFKNDQRDAFIITQMTLKNVNQNVFISPRKIERYYEENTNSFNIGESAKIRMIVIDKSKHALGEPQKIAAEVAAKLKEGGDFAKLADQYSDDSRRIRGGDRGWIENKDSDLRSELREFVFAAQPGAVSDAIDLDGAVFMIKVEERKSAGMRPISEVRDEVEQMLRNLEKERLRKQWMARLRKKSFIAYY